MFKDFINLLYPQPCLACGTILTTTEDSICTSCIINLPKTNYHLHNENPLNKIFWGRVSIEMVAAYYFFNKGNKVQNLLHQLKYKGAKNVGEKIGLLYGYELLEFNNFKDVDFIVPVPLHPKKLKKRGYNQSESFANGLAQSLKKEVVTNLLLRTVNSETQTKKSRFNRWENVATIFTISNASAIEGKHVLLVDDVITTGATIEGCAQLLTQNNATVSVVTIACA